MGRRTVLAMLAAVALGLGACGSSSSSSSSTGGSSSSSASSAGAAVAPSASATTSQIEHAKTKFVLHAGLAFGAFHRWIYKPAKAGDLSHPLQHKVTAVKAALAGAFVYHELGLALKDAQSDPTLSKLVAPITDLQNRIHGVSSDVKSTGTSAATAGSLDSTVSSIKDQASAAGQPITEQTPASPGG